MGAGQAVAALLVSATLLVAVVATPVAAQPGQLLQATPISGAPSGAKAWRIRYETRDRDGRRTESTGVVVAPDSPAPAGGRNVVAWAHGTTGIAQACAPSLSKKAVTGIPGLSDMITRGWTVAASDYPGLGTSGPHAYLVGEEAANAVIDSARAARSLPAARASSRFAVWGHSQGGHAALFTGQQARRYAPELQLVGIVAAAPPTDLVANLTYMDPIIRGVLTALTAQSWSWVYGADLSTIANKTTQGVISRTAKTCEGESSLAGLVRAVRLRHRLGDVDLTGKEPWLGLLTRNAVGTPDRSFPQLIIQGNADPLIAASVTRNYVGRVCKTGARVRLAEFSSKDHAGIAIATATDAIRWMADRFAGQTAPSTCE